LYQLCRIVDARYCMSPCVLEKIHIFFNSFSVRNTVKYSAPLFAREEYQRNDYEILKALTQRMTDEVIPAHLKNITPEIILDMELKNGPYSEQ
jgi:hypothetical protein